MKGEKTDEWDEFIDLILFTCRCLLDCVCNMVLHTYKSE